MKETANANKKRPIFKQLISGIIILLLLAAALYIYRDSFSDILNGIRKISLRDLIGSALLSTVFMVMEGSIIFKMAGAVSPAYRLKSGISTAYRCEFYRLITLGSGTGIAEIHYLHKDGIEPAAGTGLSILQFVMKKIGVALCGIIGFLLLYCFPVTRALCRDYAAFLAAGCVITTAIVLALLSVTLSASVMNFVLHILDRLSAKFPRFSKKAASLKEQVKLLNESGHIFFGQKRSLALIVLFNLVKLTAIYCIPAYLMRESTEAGFVECAALMAAVYMLAGVIPAPSGIGSLEFVYLLLFGVLISSQTAVPTLLVFRFVTWILPFMIGGILCLTDYCKTLAESKGLCIRFRK